MNIVIVGANSEILKSVLRLYAAPENHFLLISRNREKLIHLKQDLILKGSASADFISSSLDSEEEINQVISQTKNKFSAIDLLLIGHGELPDQMELEKNPVQISQAIFTNFTSYIILLLGFANIFENQKNGKIAVISSVAGDRGRRSNYFYGSNKGALQIFLEGFSARMSRSNVHVIDIRPGMVNTPMTAHLKKGLLFANPINVARDIKKAIQANKTVCYTPFFWRYILLIIKLIPRKIFYKLNF